MRFVIIFLVGFSYVTCKSNTRALTESMGQEVIEIGAPIKDLPPDFEEEPSADPEDIGKVTSTTLQAATPKDLKKETTFETRRKVNNIENTVKVKQDEDETRIEKELAELYKDAEYKADSGEVDQELKMEKDFSNATEKPIGRMRKNFKFQPDRNNPREVERFRTSIDDINCGKNKLVGKVNVTNSGFIPTLCKVAFWGFLTLI